MKVEEAIKRSLKIFRSRISWAKWLSLLAAIKNTEAILDGNYVQFLPAYNDRFLWAKYSASSLWILCEKRGARGKMNLCRYCCIGSTGLEATVAKRTINSKESSIESLSWQKSSLRPLAFRFSSQINIYHDRTIIYHIASLISALHNRRSRYATYN